MRWPAALDRLAPDIGATLRRFPLPALLCLAMTTLFIVVINADLEGSDKLARLLAALGTAAIFAAAGVLLREGGAPRPVALIAEWLVPVVVFVAWLVKAPAFYVPYLLPLIGVLWLSVASTWPRRDQPDAEARFWWINHQAITTAVVAVAAGLLIGLGLLAIERSVSLLFSIELGTIVYRYLLPVAVFLLLPIYWLSTLPHPGGFASETLERPDFLARAAGFLGQFVLAPLLGAYALILAAYTVQIVVQQALPVGVLGWMVMAFVIGGAATYLLVWPPFMRARTIARLYLGWWFWLTLIPLALFAVAVGVRVSAYGLTPERIGLIGGGLWAALLALAFILRRGDIRMIPGLAALVILIASIGPWNYVNGPLWSQSARLDAAMARAGASEGRAVTWAEPEAAEARSALTYLLYNDGRDTLRATLAARGYAVPNANSWDVSRVADALGLPPATSPGGAYAQLPRERGRGVEIGSNALVLGPITVTSGGSDSRAGLTLALDDNVLGATLADGRATELPLAAWLASQSETVLTEPELRFELDARRFLLVVDTISLNNPAGGAAREGTITWLQGTLLELLK